MIRINLLPHREQRKAAHRRRFQLLLVLFMAGSLLLLGLAYFYVTGQTERQNLRNEHLQGAINGLNQQLKDIETLRNERDTLLARKQLVERLQQGRNDAVKLFDQLIRLTPDGVYLREMRQSGTTLTLSGYALSGARVSGYMRALAASPLFLEPVLIEVKAGQVNNQRVNEFSLNVGQRPPETAPSANPAAQGQPQ
ncbi:PilN domain-containing protein [Gulbenkiania mobilis]|uniref:Type IV pilus assembly protein PilN n=1 Tax=Gulbenkiania mobilis TaxID=397457 RepID=A0ABY2CX23_GULMO|nr:PilN domain-containing protein [Gulbenkiania mobilis]TCW31699.1 type IV pilus assembly protein PilN [Gulbenkiania mobilis]